MNNKKLNDINNEDLEILNLSENINTAKPHKKPKKKSSHRKKSFFKKGLSIYLFILCSIFIVILAILWSKLNNYQKEINNNESILEQEKLSKRAPQLLFENTYNSMTVDDWVNAYYETNPNSLNREEDIRNMINSSILSADTSLWKASDYTDNAPIFLVKEDDSEIAKFYITGKNNNISVTKIEILLKGSYSDEITVPASCTVLCNNKVLDISLAEDVDSNLPDDYKDDLINPVSYKRYKVNELLSEAEFTIESSDNSYTIDTDVAGNYYLVLSEGSQYQSEAENFVKALLNFYSQGKTSASTNMATALNYVASGSTASSIIKQSLDGVLWRYPTNISYETSFSDTYVIADNCYFVDIYYKDANSESDEKEIYRVYFINLGNGFKIYSFAMM